MRKQAHVLVRGVFAFIGLVLAVAGGWYAHEQTADWALAAFVFMITSYVVGRGVPDVITDPDKGRRIAFFGIPPVFAVAGLIGAYALSDTWWLAVVLGFVAYFVGGIVTLAMLPRIAAEEHADDLSRLGRESGPATVTAREVRPARPEQRPAASVPGFSDKYGDNRL